MSHELEHDFEQQLRNLFFDKDINKLRNFLSNQNLNTDGLMGAMWDILRRSACYNYLNSVRVLIEYGADPNLQSAHGYTALHYAAEYGHITRVQALISVGADCSILNDFGLTAFDIAKDDNTREALGGGAATKAAI